MPAPARNSQDSDSERPAKVAPRKHSIYSHFPKNRNCEVCLRTKMTRAPCRRRTGEAVPRAEKFDDLITTAHEVLNEESGSRNNHRYAVVVQDLASQWIQSYPCKTKTSQETDKSLRNFLEPSRKPKVFCTGNSLEFGKSRQSLSWDHRPSTPHRSETNGIAERAVRRVKEGTSAVSLQSGLGERWWSDSVECFRYLRHVQDLLADGKTPFEFGEPFKGPIISSGALVEYHPISTRDQLRIHRKKVFPGIFLWCALIAERLWKGCSACRCGRIGKDGRIRNLSLPNQSKGSIDHAKTIRIHFPSRGWHSKIVRKRPRIPSTHSETGITCKE